MHADCPGLGPIGEDPNVGWVSLPDSIAACPAGDSVVAGHPSRVRGVIFYGDDCHNPRSGVPPDSMWITTGFAVKTAYVRNGTAQLRVYDSRGRLVATVNGKAGDRLYWTGRSNDGTEVRSRLYFYKALSAGVPSSGKWVFLK